MWAVILSFCCKLIIQFSIGQPREEIFGKYFYIAEISFLVLLPIKKEVNNKNLKTVGNICLVIFYITLISLCLMVYIEHKDDVPS